MTVRVIGYCASCAHFRRWASERPINHGQQRFGRCRIKVLVDRPNAMCERYEAATGPDRERGPRHASA